MDSHVKLYRSLPPLVEGKVYGSLKLVIDEILWIKKSPGNVTVVASWWGECDNARFRPIESITDTTRINKDTIEIYAVKTNAVLFEDYIKNCETIELTIISEKTQKVIGTAHIGELFKIFEYKPCFQYISILSNGNKIGEIHVSLQLTYLAKPSSMQLKMYKHNQKQIFSDIFTSTADNLCNKEIPVISNKDTDNSKKRNSIKLIKDDTFDTYKSVYKTKRPEPRNKINEIVTDKLIGQIVSKVQHLRGAILKETYNEDSLTLSDISIKNELENEAKLSEYILGKEMSSFDEKKALNTLRSISPTPSLIDLASKTITASKYDDMSSKYENSPTKLTNFEDTGTYCKDLLDYVDSIKIYIQTCTLNPAGYRRVKSTFLQSNVPLSPTYFVQYDTLFTSEKQTDIKSNRENRFIRTCAKKQVDQVVDFNSESVYDISRKILNRDFSLKFKLLVRHFNQKLPTELGCGSINITDVAKSTNLSSTQCITIINKGLKIGELKVTIELGCNYIYFGKEFIDIVISAKENIPMLKKSLVNINDNKYRTVTGTHSSKSTSKNSAKRIERLTNNSNKNLIVSKDITEHQKQTSDNRKIDISNLENDVKNKILLRGLIYVAEGKDLPGFNTYLICRAFWREDKATSEICSNTNNPLYHFFQLIPLIHDTELLKRIRDNYIIIEVYNRQNGETDDLLGIAKLPVHQLYVAYRDPFVLPHLLLSKYPVISVDGWVSINDPINGKSCGELLALVALGTAEQISLLEMSRGLRNTAISSQLTSKCHCASLDGKNNTTNTQENLQCSIPELNSLGQFNHNNDFACHIYNTPDRDLNFVNYKSQAIQTDISVLKNVGIVETPFAENTILHRLLKDSTNVCALNANKINTDQSAQTEMKQADEMKIDEEELCLNTLNSNSNLCDDNVTCSLRNNFQLSTEMYRSVGVGAEHDEELDQQQNNAFNNLSNSSIIEENLEKQEINTNCDSSFFRAIVEIECALHLPKIERLNESVEPSTYVTFQDLNFETSSNSQLNSYIVTNIFPYSCDPKWNWRCDAKLPTELLTNNEKRLILKVWHLIDQNKTAVVNLEKDIVIGFSAVDLSVLIAGLPMVSGWFHIMDFAGKCNGQIKISITPVDNLASFGKFVPININNFPKNNNVAETNWLHSYNACCNDISKNVQQTSFGDNNKEIRKQDDNNCDESDSATDASHCLEGVSLSILSLSLKQKLDELQDITKRLQSRLRDVTNTAFEDEFDSDFDANESNSESEYVNNRNIAKTSIPIATVYSSDETLLVPKQCETHSDRNTVSNERQTSFVVNNDYNPQFVSTTNQNKAINLEATNTENCSSSNMHFNQRPIQHCQNKNPCNITHNYLLDSNAEYPARGTRTHINHLLDKLSLNLAPRPLTEMDIPIKKNIIDLFAKLREHKNNSQDKNENCAIDSCSVSIQTDDKEQHTHSSAMNHAISDTSDVGIDENVPRSTEESCNKISTVIREELIAEDDFADWDDLTTYLVTTNIRCKNLDGIINPLLYQYLMPDLQIVSNISPEGEAVEQLDNRYAKNFNTVMNSDKIIHSAENNALSETDICTKDQTTHSIESEETTELLRLTPSSVSGNVNSNVDITVLHKTRNNNVISDNKESSIITSFKKLSMQQTDTTTENYCCTVSETSIPGVFRQAPDGGNPVEEIKTSIATKRQNDKA